LGLPSLLILFHKKVKMAIPKKFVWHRKLPMESPGAFYTNPGHTGQRHFFAISQIFFPE